MAERIIPLLIDSQGDKKEWITKALRDISLDYMEVDSIEDAVKISRPKFNLILLGVDLLDCQGEDCIRRIKKEFPLIGIVVVVRAGEEELADKCVRAGAQGFIQVGTLGNQSVGTLLSLAYHRQQAQNLNYETINQLTNLVKNLPGFIYRCLNDEHWTVEYISEGVQEITGYPPESLINNQLISYSDIIHPDDRVRIQKIIDEAAKRDARFQLDYRILTADHTEKWLWEQGSSIRTETGTSILEGYVTDITDQKVREHQMQAIIEAGNMLRNALRLNEFCPNFLEWITKIYETECASFFLPTNRENILNQQFAVGKLENRVGMEMPVPEKVQSAVDQGKKVLLFGCEDPEIALCPSLMGNPSAYFCFLPLVIDTRKIGILTLGRERKFNESELTGLTAISDILVSTLERSNLLEKVETQIRHLESLHAIDQAITSNFDLQVVNKIILDQVCKELDGDAADILILNKATNLLENYGSVGFRDSMIRSIRVPLTTSIAGKSFLEKAPIYIPDLEENPLWFIRKNMQVENFKAYFVHPMSMKGETIGVLEIFMRKVFYPDRDWEIFLNALTTQAAVAFESFKKYTELYRTKQNMSASFHSTLEILSKSLELHDFEAEGHIRRVTGETIRLAKELGVDAEKLPDIERGALLHDIGKIGIMDEILLKKGDLTEQDWAEIKRHPEIARDLLSNVDLLQDALDIPYSHHENWDGSGYPQGLKGEEIPLAARIFAVVDTFDALTTPKPYRDAWTRVEARRYLEDQSGKKFDPEIVDHFIHLFT